MVFDCSCGKRKNILSERALSYHIQLKHRLDDESETFECPVLPNECKGKFKGSCNILRHFRTNHQFDSRFNFLNGYAGSGPVSNEDQRPVNQEQQHPNNQQPVEVHLAATDPVQINVFSRRYFT